ncbi:MAG: outer membrane adhesin like protein, partial [uncultured bacterium]
AVPDCTSVDDAPTVTTVTSTTANGYYKVGGVIDIAVTFSEAVSGDVLVTLETGEIDRTCSFSVAAESAGTCDYTVKTGDASADLTVQSVTGTITDGSGDTLATPTPTINLAANKNIVIDTAKPLVPTKLKIYSSKQKTKRLKTINPRTFSKIVKAKSVHPYFTWSAVADVSKYYTKFTDKKISRQKLLNSKNKSNKTNASGKITQIGKKYYLYMLLRDQAGNQSKVKTLLTYKAE